MHRKQGNVVSLLSNVNTKADLMQADRLFQQLAESKLKAASLYMHLTLATTKSLYEMIRGLSEMYCGAKQLRAFFKQEVKFKYRIFWELIQTSESWCSMMKFYLVKTPRAAF